MSFKNMKSSVSKVNTNNKRNATKTGTKTGEDKHKKKHRGHKGILKIGSVFEGQVSYTITRLVRIIGTHAEYYVKADNEMKTMRLGPSKKNKLKWAADILKKVKKLGSGESEEEKNVLEYFEYGENNVQKANFLVTNAYGLQLHELRKALHVNQLSPGCVLNIAAQTLMGIKTLHSVGILHRNIKPTSFSIGYGAKEVTIYLADFRIARQHFEETTDIPRPARPRVAWLGSARYASVAAMREQDQGRKDDLESWIYMVYSLYDLNVLPWKHETKMKTLLLKQMLKNHSLSGVYEVIPKEFKALFDLLSPLKYSCKPDYDSFHEVIVSVSKKHQLDMTACDWAGKLTPSVEVKAIVGCDQKSADDICSGEDDFEYGNNKKHGKRVYLKTNDIMKSNGNVWKIVSKLGSGGFGDVYKVMNEKWDKPFQGLKKKKSADHLLDRNVAKAPKNKKPTATDKNAKSEIIAKPVEKNVKSEFKKVSTIQSVVKKLSAPLEDDPKTAVGPALSFLNKPRVEVVGKNRKVASDEKKRKNDEKPAKSSGETVTLKNPIVDNEKVNKDSGSGENIAKEVANREKETEKLEVEKTQDESSRKTVTLKNSIIENEKIKKDSRKAETITKKVASDEKRTKMLELIEKYEKKPSESPKEASTLKNPAVQLKKVKKDSKNAETIFKKVASNEKNTKKLEVIEKKLAEAPKEISALKNPIVENKKVQKNSKSSETITKKVELKTPEKVIKTAKEKDKVQKLSKKESINNVTVPTKTAIIPVGELNNTKMISLSSEVNKNNSSQSSIKKKKYYAMKTEYEEGKKSMLRLKVEMQVFMAITEERKKNEKGTRHFLEFIDRGKNDELKCKFIVMSLVGPSLDDCKRKFNVNLARRCTPFIIAIQTLQAIRDLHQIGFLHRDIKPANFAVGLGNQESTIFMLDFGICRSYIDRKTNKHKAPRKSVKFLGTLRFASRACISNKDQGRKDDLECWIYMIFDIMDSRFGRSWKANKDRDQVLASKKRIFQKSPSEFPSDSKCFQPLVEYLDSLEYQSTPDYEFMEKRIYEYAEQSGNEITSMKNVEWIGKLKVTKQEDQFGLSDTRSDHRSGSNDDDE